MGKVGDELGGYVLDRLLGAGASASVYLAHDGGGTPVALKLLDLAADLGQRNDVGYGTGADGNVGEGARARLRAEATALMRLRIPGIAQVLDLEVDGVEAFLVTEYIPGPTLAEDVASAGAWELDEAAELGELLADTLTAVHARGIAHRDIKPANVILSAEGPVLIDFGIAAAEGEVGLTRTGLVVGTPGFISPEAISGLEGSDSMRDDWWSLTALLLYVCTGRAPFGGGSPQVQISRVLAGNPDVAGLPAGLGEMFRFCLRPLSAGSRGHLRDLLAGLRNPGSVVGLEPGSAGADSRPADTLSGAAWDRTRVLEPVEEAEDSDFSADHGRAFASDFVSNGTRFRALDAVHLAESTVDAEDVLRAPDWIDTPEFSGVYPGAGVSSVPSAGLADDAEYLSSLPKFVSRSTSRIMPFFGLTLTVALALLAPTALSVRPGISAEEFVDCLRGGVLPSVNPKFLAIFAVVLIGIILLYWLPPFALLRRASRRITRAVLPRWWLRALVGSGLLALAGAALVLT